MRHQQQPPSTQYLLSTAFCVVMAGVENNKESKQENSAWVVFQLATLNFRYFVFLHLFVIWLSVLRCVKLKEALLVRMIHLSELKSETKLYQLILQLASTADCSPTFQQDLSAPSLPQPSQTENVANRNVHRYHTQDGARCFFKGVKYLATKVETHLPTCSLLDNK